MSKDIKISIETLRKTKGIGQKTLERILEQHKIDNNIKSFKSKYTPSSKYTIDKDINLWQGDCLELMNHIPDESIDMILADLPYGTTACSWDEIIPFEPLWSHYKRIIKDNGAIVLFGDEPFSSRLRLSNVGMYKYDWKWEKERITNIFQVKNRAGKTIEDVMVFYKEPPNYNPQMIKYNGKLRTNKVKRGKLGKLIDSSGNKPHEYKDDGLRYPTQLLSYQRDILTSNLHPTQKPVALLEYLIKTYTNEGMTVLDNTMGSGSTGVACKNLDRRFIGIELDEEYFNIAKERIYGGVEDE